MGPKWWGFLPFFKVFSLVCSRIKSRMKLHTVIYASLLTPYLAKFWFSRYGPKCSQLIRLQDSVKCNISRKNQVDFVHISKNQDKRLGLVRYTQRT